MDLGQCSVCVCVKSHVVDGCRCGFRSVFSVFVCVKSQCCRWVSVRI